MHGFTNLRVAEARPRPLPPFRSLLCAIALAGLSWAVPDVAQAYSEAMTLESGPRIGRTGHSLKPTRVLKYFQHLPQKVHALAVRVHRGLVKKKPVLMADGRAETGPSSGEGDAPPAKERSDGRQNAKPRVLLVEDRADNQNILKLMFEGVGCEVVVAAPGAKEGTAFVVSEGLRLMEVEGPFDGVGSDGLEGDWTKIADAAKEKGIGCCVITGRPDQHRALAKAYDIPLYAKPARLKHFKEMKDYFVGGAGDQQQPE